MSGFTTNPFPSAALRWASRERAFRSLTGFRGHPGLGDGTDVLTGTNTIDDTNVFDLMSPPPAITTSVAPEPTMNAPFPSSFLYDIASPVSSAFQQAQASLAAMFPSSGGSSSPSAPSNILQSFSNYVNGTASPAEVNYFTSLPASVTNQLQNLILGLPASTSFGSGSSASSSSGINVNQAVQGALASTEKILQQVTLPSGQIQITGPNGQSEIIQTNANTAGIGIPGLNSANSSGLFSILLIIGGGIFLVSLLEEHH